MKKNNKDNEDLIKKIEEKYNDKIVELLEIKKRADKFNHELKGYISFLDNQKQFWQKHRNIVLKINALIRLLCATDNGLKRMALKMYDVDKNIIEEELKNEK